uniref:Uncharacterized protein n=1 Tax=Theropithecus gelada TaxID=9565 RepID=A0A8D2FQM0_THEGE
AIRFVFLKETGSAELEAAQLAKEKELIIRQQVLLAKKEKDIQKRRKKKHYKGMKERQKLGNSSKIWNHFSNNEAG